MNATVARMIGSPEKLIDPEMIGLRLRLTREALGLNHRDLCRPSEIAENAYSQYETGKRPLTLIPALRLRQTFGVTLDWLFCGDRSGLPGRILSKLSSPPIPARERQRRRHAG